MKNIMVARIRSKIKKVDKKLIEKNYLKELLISRREILAGKGQKAEDVFKELEI